MIVTADPSAARAWTLQKRTSARVGLVPTMGALHQGHLSLVHRAQQLADEVAVSIFVNPTQFAPTEDLDRYPRPLQDDLELLRQCGASLVFTPAGDTIYPAGFSTHVEPPSVAQRWEGNRRPGHFRGVCTVVLKLFQMMPADIAVFGRKDFQQSRVIQAMVRDLNLPIQIDVAETIREHDGLAMSSRNRYLSQSDRHGALQLSAALRAAKLAFDNGERRAEALQRILTNQLLHQSHRVDLVDYAVVVDQTTLEPIEIVQSPAVMLIAASVGNTRLIDNETLP